ncbi:hypothetical protein [Streptomyces sp. NPDC021139]
MRRKRPWSRDFRFAARDATLTIMAVRHHPILGVEQMSKVLADQDGF